MISKQHAAAKLEQGLWVCNECGSESLDFELFEESGEFEKCSSRSIAERKLPNPNDVVDWAAVERVRQRIDTTREAMKEFGNAAETATETITSFNSGVSRSITFAAGTANDTFIKYLSGAIPIKDKD